MGIMSQTSFITSQKVWRPQLKTCGDLTVSQSDSQSRRNLPSNGQRASHEATDSDGSEDNQSQCSTASYDGSQQNNSKSKSASAAPRDIVKGESRLAAANSDGTRQDKTPTAAQEDALDGKRRTWKVLLTPEQACEVAVRARSERHFQSHPADPLRSSDARDRPAADLRAAPALARGALHHLVRRALPAGAPRAGARPVLGASAEGRSESASAVPRTAAPESAEERRAA